MFYSKSTGGFYSTEIHGSAIPVDAASLTGDEYEALMRGQADGSVIVGNAAGIPELASRQYTEHVEPAASKIIRLEREQLLPRVTREFMLLTMEAQFTPGQLAQHPAYVKLKAFDTAVTTLRAQL